MPSFENDEERFEALKDAITDSYATGAGRARRRSEFYAKRVAALAVAGCAVIAVFAGVLIVQWRAAIQVRDETQSIAPAGIAENTISPYTPPPYKPYTPPPSHKSRPPRPAPTKAPTATPSPAPTATASPTSAPTASPTSAPTATPSPSPIPSAVAIIHNAFTLVHSNGLLRVGKRGSCGGLDVTVEVRGYPKGCTVFDADTTGPLRNGRGTVLVVPVSSTEDVQNVVYGLVYVRSSDADAPHFVGLIRGDGSPITVRLQRGVIMEETNADTRYFTFNGRRIVRVWLNGDNDLGTQGGPKGTLQTQVTALE